MTLDVAVCGLQPPRSAAPYYVWALATNQVTALPMIAARVSGHDGIGWGYLNEPGLLYYVNLDAAQWQIVRSLASPFSLADLISPVLLPKEIALADHQSWTHAQAGKLVPIISANYRVGLEHDPMAGVG